MAASALLVLNGTTLTDQGRIFDEESELKKVDVELANGGVRRYGKAVKKKFKISWTWLPSQDAQTWDGKAGRDTIKALVTNSSMTFTVLKRDGSTDSYTVLVDSYSETLLRRDIAGFTNFFWDISLELIEA